MAYNYLKSQIASLINSNGRREITGGVLDEALELLIDGVGYLNLVGLATTTTNPGTPDKPSIYLCEEKGTYTYFNNIEVTEDICFLCWNGTVWSKVTKNIDISISLGETSTKAYRGDRGKIAYEHSQVPHAPILGFTPEDISNKSTDIEADKTSNIKYPTVKSIYDWVIGLVGNITELTTSYKLNIVGAINELVTNKVDKITGKSLSTNDFDDEYKNKVDAAAGTIPKTDWNAQSGSITELVNKPTAQQIFDLAANNPSVGTYCHAGLIVYKAVAGDKAYIPTNETVLVALTAELPDSIFSNVTTSVAVTGNYADIRGLGVGRNNTFKILEQVGNTDLNSGAFRARVYYPKPYTGFTEPGVADQDWSIPSIEELRKVLIYKDILGMSGNYMTSNDFEASRFWAIDSTTWLTNAVTKTTPTKVKPVCWIRYSPRISGTNTGDETQSTIIAKSAPYSKAYNTYYGGELATTIPVIQLNSITSQRQYLNLNLNGVRGSIDLRVFSHDIVWDGDWISVSIGNSTDFTQAHLLNKVDIVIETGFGVINSSGLAKLVPGTGERLLKVICLDGRLNLETDFSRVIFRFYPSLYNSQFGTSKWVNRVYGETLLQSSPNIIINGTSSTPSHSTYMRDTFVWYYNKYGTFSGSSYITNLDSSLPTEPIAGEAVPGRLPSGQYASYPRSKDSDIILNPFQNSLIPIDMASMPDIYNIVCHGRDPIPLTAVTLTAGTTGDNYYGWVNYTATTPADGCVVRFTGLTNNPTLNNVDLKVIYGTSTKFGLALLDGTRVIVTSNDSGTMIKGIGGEFNFYKYYEPDNINTSSFFAVNSIAVGAGKLSDSDANWQSSYGQGVEFIESTVSDDMIGCPVSWWNLQQQSPAVAIVAAKMKYIKDTTNVSWSTVRMACRETALQSDDNIANNIKWDKYRGFGVIQVAEAITWINLRKSSSRNTIKNSLSLGTLPTYINSSNSIPDMHPLPKKFTLEKPKGNYASNAAALTAGLQIGDIYHTSGIIKVVI